MDQWFAKAPGSILIETESSLLSNLIPHLFGYYLLQLGMTSKNNWLSNCRIPQRIHLSPECPCHFVGPCVQGNFEELPFLPDSIDVALLPHVLEFAHNPQQILEEVYRVLIPEGYAVILGFHPWSLWGLAKVFVGRKKIPWVGKFYSSYRVRHWLTLQGFKVEDHETLFFRPPLTNTKWLKKLFFLEAVGQLLWPYLGGVYLIVAKKRVATLTPFRSKLLSKYVKVTHGVVQPTASVNN
jgi:SAM-dependent methyltransferase